MKTRTDIPLPPSDVPEAVQSEFRTLVELMTDPKPADAPAILLAARSLATWRAAQAEVDRLGPVVASGGAAIANPSLAIASTAHKQIIELLPILGLTPSSRAKLNPPRDGRSGLPSLVLRKGS